MARPDPAINGAREFDYFLTSKYSHLLCSALAPSLGSLLQYAPREAGRMNGPSHTSSENPQPSTVIESLLKRRLEQAHSDADPAAHLELLLNSGCYVWTEPNGEQTRPTACPVGKIQAI